MSLRQRLFVRRILFCVWLLLIVWLLTFQMRLFAQDASTGGIRGIVQDEMGARVASAAIVVTEKATGFRRGTMTNSDGSFRARFLPVGAYDVEIEAPGMAPLQVPGVLVQLGAETELKLTVRVKGNSEAVTVSAPAVEMQTKASENAQIIDQNSIAELPLNGRRFSDLALLVPGMVADPRGMTSDSNGDLSSGGIRGYQTSFLVDGADNNNSFYAQARGRYRAPYQFSNEVVQEFRVNTNNYSAELGRAGAAVINVVTKSGSNEFHGKAFYYLRDNTFGAQHPDVGFKPEERQHQFGATLGGPIRKNRAFFLAGWDQQIFHVPTVVRFDDGSAKLVPTAADYEASDRSLVGLAAGALNSMAGTFESQLIGNAGFAKVDVVLSPKNLLSARVNTSRYYGDNNVYFDPASPITHYAITENGEEDVSTISSTVSLISGITRKVTSNARVQFSRDWQGSTANTDYARTSVANIIEGFGRSLIMPRETHEWKLHAAENIGIDTRRNNWKFGADFIATKIYNYFPLQFGGGYQFNTIRVDPFTFQPETYGMELTPLRAYAHLVPRYYMQNFGNSESRPDTDEYAAYAQDSFRIGNLGLTLGLRYDLQTFRSDRLLSNPVFPASGKAPEDTNNISPRFGFAYSFGGDRPLMLRGGWGLFYTRIPSIYNSEVEADNGLNRTHLFLDNADFYDRQVFPAYPNTIAACDPGAKTCQAPATVSGNLTSEIAAFSPTFQTPFVQQASAGIEKEVADHLELKVSYLYTHGEHLIRARDVNLPTPVRVSYPVFDESGNDFLGSYYDVDAFSPWITTKTLACPFPPCAGDVQRPISQVGAINVFESAATSVYHGLTASIQRRMTRGLFFRIGYTWGQAIDDGQDALVVGRPAQVQNSYSPSERSWSSVDQRQRWVGAWTYRPRFFAREHPSLRALLDNWKFSGVMTYGSGRPVSARVIGDANRDGNDGNDRLPGYSRNAFLGPNYMTTDMRFGKTFRLAEYLRLELMAEAFNVFNRDNKRVNITDDGFDNSAASFVYQDTVVNAKHFPAQYRVLNGFMIPTDSYAPRQLQFAIRLFY
jgi:hypothetical protein